MCSQNLNNKKVTFGVMCNGNSAKLWQKKCLNKILNLDNVELDLVIKDSRTKKAADMMKNVRPGQILFQLYYNHVRKSRMMKDVKIEKHIEEADEIPVSPDKKEKYSEHFPKEKTEKIKNYNLDFIIRFAFGIIKGDILSAPKYGVWSFHHDDERIYRGGPPGFWEVYYGDEYNGCILQRLTNRLDGGYIIERGKVKTCKTNYPKNLDNVLKKSTELPVKACKKLLQGCSPIKSESRSEADIYSYPDNWTFLKFIARIAKRSIIA